MKEVTQPGFPETDDILYGNWGGGSFPKGDQILLGSIKGDSSYSPYNGSLNVPLCTPYILAGIVFEIDKGTRVLTHSPNAIHKRRAANIVAIDRYLASGSRRQCDQHHICLPSSYNIFAAFLCVAVQFFLCSPSYKILQFFCGFM